MKYFDSRSYVPKVIKGTILGNNVVTLTGSSGTAKISINGVANTTNASYAGASLTTTAANWVTANYNYYKAKGFIVTSASEVITVAAVNPWDTASRINVTIANLTTNLSGTLTSILTIDLSNVGLFYPVTTIDTTTKIVAGIKPIAGGSATIRLIGDGTNTPTFSGFNQSSQSETYDPTLSAVNLVHFFYDGVDYWYSITLKA
jgi:hypothetical protein